MSLILQVEHIGIHPNEQDKRYGATPLHYAASSGHLKMVKFLLPRVMKVQPDYDGATPLHDAAVQGHMAVSESQCSTLNDQSRWEPCMTHLISRTSVAACECYQSSLLARKSR